jgi:small subunit ribosomal protein S12
MPTISQLVRKGRKVLVDKSKSPALDNVLSVVAFVFVCTQRPLKSLIRQCVRLPVFV